MVLKKENLREYSEDDFVSKMYERYIIFCKSRNLDPVVKSLDKFASKFKVFLSKDKTYIQLFFDNYFVDDLNTFYYHLNLSLKKPKEEKKEEKKEESKVDNTKKEIKVKE